MPARSGAQYEIARARVTISGLLWSVISGVVRRSPPQRGLYVNTTIPPQATMVVLGVLPLCRLLTSVQPVIDRCCGLRCPCCVVRPSLGGSFMSRAVFPAAKGLVRQYHDPTPGDLGRAGRPACRGTLWCLCVLASQMSHCRPRYVQMHNQSSAFRAVRLGGFASPKSISLTRLLSASFSMTF